MNKRIRGPPNELSLTTTVVVGSDNDQKPFQQYVEIAGFTGVKKG